MYLCFIYLVIKLIPPTVAGVPRTYCVLQSEYNKQQYLNIKYQQTVQL